MPREVIKTVLPNEAKEVQSDLLLGREDTVPRRPPFPTGAIEQHVPHVHSYAQRCENVSEN